MIITSEDGRQVDITVNYDQGVITGPGAQEIRRIIAASNGIAFYPPVGPSIPAPSPLTSPKDMAHLLQSAGYVIPEDLASQAPLGPEFEIPEGAVA